MSDKSLLYIDLKQQLQTWAQDAGFQDLGITDQVPENHLQHLRQWLADGFHGEMSYMADRLALREQPEQLQPGCLRIISLRMDYASEENLPVHLLDDPTRAYVARYTLGRDYHKVIRPRLADLSRKMLDWLEDHDIQGHTARGFTDSAPVLEKAIAERAGLGWVGKNTLLLNEKAGSLFFVAEILTDIPLPVDPPYQGTHCGSCRRCIDVCPTDAIVAPFRLDARRCISYLTIESREAIPEPFRKPMGNRIFGCDDCQLYCPWNKFARSSAEPDFQPRHQLDQAELLSLFLWDEATFLKRTEGSAIRRTGYEGWQRNLAVALGNGEASDAVIRALRERRLGASDLVAEHIDWALAQLTEQDSTQHC
ncbi:MAG: tRNA epoxyqueuosine(34) reductase QueG [Pseudomonadales bacterium]|nr:tRNA epoxyqueuosine(34) reductase QueG [Pseudomonadales bacterium]